MKTLMTLTLLAATPALAECPTGADLAGGIRVIETDDTTHIYRSLKDGIVQVDIAYGGDTEFASRNLLAQGNHVLQLADTENGVIVPDSISNTAYPARADQLPPPSPNAVWTVQTTVRGYGDLFAETQTHRWGDLFTLSIGTCSYQAIEGALSYVSDESTIQEGVYFIPELGISLLYSVKDEAMDAEIFAFSKIETVQ